MPSSSAVSDKRPASTFIGAVEDEWQLYTSVLLSFSSLSLLSLPPRRRHPDHLDLHSDNQYRLTSDDVPYSDNAADYTLGPAIGFGASSTVYSAIHHPPPTPSSPTPNPVPCALKVLDLDKLPPHSLRLLERETQLMSLSKHPNVLRVRGSWIEGHKLHIALRLMNAGSAADVMRYGWPGGMSEEVVRCILKQALEGLNYLHINGFIHRDVKAANLLIDDDGTVLLGDLGVAAPLHDEDHTHPHLNTKENGTNSKTDRSVVFDAVGNTPPRRARVGKRRSFVGTPCWMAPELISGKHYDSSADIWSFGITALELAQGRAPRSRESSHNVLLKTVQDAAPTLDRDGGVHKYSRAFQEVVGKCLAKDPAGRPTAAQLLQTPFFKNAKRKSYLVGTILHDLPPIVQRLERLQARNATLHRTIDSWDFSTSLLPGLLHGHGHGHGHHHHHHQHGPGISRRGSADSHSYVRQGRMSGDGHGRVSSDGHGRMSGDGHSMRSIASSRRERGISGDGGGGGEVFELDEVFGTGAGAEEVVEDEDEDEEEGAPSSSSASGSQRSSSPDSTHSNSAPSASSPEDTPDSTQEPSSQPEAHAPTATNDLSSSPPHRPSHSPPTPIPTPLPSTTNSLSPTRPAHSRTPSTRSTLSSVFNDSTEGIGLSSSPPSLVVGLPSSAGSSGGGGGGGGGGGFSGSPVGGLWRRLRKGSMGVVSGSNGGVAGAEDNSDADANSHANGAVKGAKRRTGSFGLAVGGRVGLLGRRKGREREEEAVVSS
ncbi:kinase-like protein [Stereum hirsutum FP-91666 SS1]|uniref:kinase-like protein n=1 Tax=Stereum hirsutum (strain FP-91666) TaxID=721885 RepID=UPI000440D07E|nr:kinase-like protein [Stereum hirsutum FP-91666 SS1]EIM92827.1 kinase-like protein [Stereum hirsutum FP-91666 SS1]